MIWKITAKNHFKDYNNPSKRFYNNNKKETSRALVQSYIRLLLLIKRHTFYFLNNAFF